MAYIPPHKRNMKREEMELRPESLELDLQQRLGMRSAGSKGRQEPVLPLARLFAENSIVRCFPVGLIENGEMPHSIRLEPYPCLHHESRTGKKYFALSNIDQQEKEMGVVDSGTSTCCIDKEAWLYIAEKIQSDVVTAIQNVRNLMADDESSELRPSFLVHVGKILFHGVGTRQSISLEELRKSFLTEVHHTSGVNKMFYTTVTDACMDFIESKAVQDVGFALKGQKKHAILQVKDKSQPDCLFLCKCTNKGDGKLELQKIEEKFLRHLVVDVSCLFQDIDLRIMLLTKEVVESFTDEEKCSLKEFIESAIVHPYVKGGLIWPLEKDSAGDRFHLQGAWRCVSKTFIGPTMKLRFRHNGLFSKQVTMKLTGVSKHLKETGGGDEAIKEALQEALKLIWDNFINCKF